MAYEKLFERGRIGAMRLKNRIVMPAMGVSMAETNGDANEHIIRYYEERAKGGVGLIITEITRVEPVYGTAIPNQLGAYSISQIPHLERLSERVHKYGTRILMQLQHPGRENKSDMIEGRQIVAPSPVMCKVTKEMPRELTTQECKDLVKAFTKAAVIAQKAGFDGVELHAAHGYLLNEFLSPYTNKRTDCYGGSFDNRVRILDEMIAAIRYMCGPRFVISVRISGDEFVDGGLKLEDTIAIARHLEGAGIDVINVSSGIYETAPTIIEPASYPQGWKKHLASGIRKNVTIPVIATNNIKDPEVAEALLEEGVCDFVALGRPHLADPQWANKAKAGRGNEITKCIGCLYCFTTLAEGGHIKCAVNPRCGREVEYQNIAKDGDGRVVVIVGGGPAGMEAALELKTRNFEPIILESENTLGGQLNVADKPILKEKLAAYKQALILQVQKAGIDVRLNTKADAAMVKAMDPYRVMLAAGGSPIVPKLPGVDGPNVMTAEDFLLSRKMPTGNAVVIGGGVTGMEAAETYAAHGGKATIVEMMDEIGRGLYRSVLADYMIRFGKLGVSVRTDSKLIQINDTGVLLQNTKTSETETLAADTVILAIGVAPHVGLREAFEAAFDDLIVIGDADISGRIAEATFAGYSRATTL